MPRHDGPTRLTIRGHHLPGREFISGGVLLRNVHVGVQVRSAPGDLVPAAMFRRAKLMLDGVEPDLVRTGQRGGCLVVTVDLTDDRQGPRCARVDPPAIAWSVG